MKTDSNSIYDFDAWDDPTSDEDFFEKIETGEKAENTPAKKEYPSEDNEGKKGEKPEEQNEPEEEEEDLFEDAFEQEGDEGDGDTFDDVEGEGDSDGDDKKTSNLETVNFLKERGVLDFDDDEEIDEEKADSIMENFDDKFEETIENRFSELMEGLPDVVKQMNRYAVKGGDVNDFLKEISKHQNETISEDMDMDDKENQKKVFREMSKRKGNDEEYTEAQLEFLEDSGKLEMMSKKDFEKWKEDKKKAAEKALETQRKKDEQIKEEIRESKKNTSDFLEENDSVNEITFSRKDKKELPSYMNDKTIKLQNGTKITQLQKDLFYEVPNNKKAYLQLAALTRNRKKDGTFDFEGIKRDMKTDVAENMRGNVRREKKKSIDQNKNRKSPRKSLADYFN